MKQEIDLFIAYLHNEKKTSENTQLSYRRDLNKLCLFLEDADLFNLIERHFTKLDLINRYNQKAIQLFSEISNRYIAQDIKDELDFDKFANTQLKAWEYNNAFYGINHWKQALERACATSSVFKRFIISSLS